MKSLYAVTSQIILSGSNYLIFLIFFKQLSTENFIGFSTAVGLNIIAYAIAEGGVSYVAPRELATNTALRKRISSSFILISTLLYIISLIVGFHLWNIASDDNLDFFWVLAYAIFFSPTLLLPPWLTCWTIGLTEVILIGVVRAAAIIVVFLHPDVTTLSLTGIAFLLFTIGVIVKLNRKVSIIGLPDWPTFKFVLKSLFEVFLSKTSSYAVYSTTPMVVSSIYGSYVASLYIAGERIKSMYSAVFYPIIQTIYLSRFQTKSNRINNYLILTTVFIINVLSSLLLILAIKSELLNLISDRFSDINNLWIYVVAAFLSVVTATFLFFIVLPDGDYQIFRKATYFQLASFIVLFILMWLYPIFSPEYVLLLGEAAILTSILIQLFLKKTSIL